MYVSQNEATLSHCSYYACRTEQTQLSKQTQPLQLYACLRAWNATVLLRSFCSICIIVAQWLSFDAFILSYYMCSNCSCWVLLRSIYQTCMVAAVTILLHSFCPSGKSKPAKLSHCSYYECWTKRSRQNLLSHWNYYEYWTEWTQQNSVTVVTAATTQNHPLLWMFSIPLVSTLIIGCELSWQ